MGDDWDDDGNPDHHWCDDDNEDVVRDGDKRHPQGISLTLFCVPCLCCFSIHLALTSLHFKC